MEHREVTTKNEVPAPCSRQSVMPGLYCAEYVSFGRQQPGSAVHTVGAHGMRFSTRCCSHAREAQGCMLTRKTHFPFPSIWEGRLAHE